MAEITIRGAGIFGLSIAWLCSLRGAPVRVIDPAGPGAGASGGLVGALAPHVPEGWNAKKQVQFDSLITAEGFWSGVVAAGGVDAGYGRTGRLQPVADEAALHLAHAREATSRDLWQGKAVWQVIPAAKAGDWAPLSASGFLIRDTLSARLHPRRACAALVAALSRRGVTVAPEGPDRGLVIWATGAAGLADLSRGRARALGGAVKGQAALLRPAHPLPADVPQLFANGLHIIAHADGSVAVGSTSEQDFDDPHATDERLDEVIARARAAVPLLADAPATERWAGLRPRARSRAPMLGPWPGRPGHLVANGGFKIGFGMAPMVADLIADLALEGHDRIPPDFRVEASL